MVVEKCGGGDHGIIGMYVCIGVCMLWTGHVVQKLRNVEKSPGFMFYGLEASLFITSGKCE